MKKTLLLIIVVALVLPMTVQAQNLVFSVKSMGLDAMQGAQFSLPGGVLQPFIGVDYIGISSTNEAVVEAKMKANMFIPFIGARYYLNVTNATKPYLFGGFFKSFPSIKVTVDGEDMLDEETEDLIKDLLGFWGIKLGFGAEYAISDWFSVGGELGFNFYNLGMQGETEIWDPDIGDFGDWTTVENDIKAALKYTYAAFVLNFFL